MGDDPNILTDVDEFSLEVMRAGSPDVDKALEAAGNVIGYYEAAVAEVEALRVRLGAVEQALQAGRDFERGYHKARIEAYPFDLPNEERLDLLQTEFIDTYAAVLACGMTPDDPNVLTEQEDDLLAVREKEIKEELQADLAEHFDRAVTNVARALASTTHEVEALRVARDAAERGAEFEVAARVLTERKLAKSEARVLVLEKQLFDFQKNGMVAKLRTEALVGRAQALQDALTQAKSFIALCVDAPDPDPQYVERRRARAAKALADVMEALAGVSLSEGACTHCRGTGDDSQRDGPCSYCQGSGLSGGDPPLRMTVEDDYAAFAEGRKAGLPDLTWHDRFARCPECQHATVGLDIPYGIGHKKGCAAALTLPAEGDPPSETGGDKEDWISEAIRVLDLGDDPARMAELRRLQRELCALARSYPVSADASKERSDGGLPLPLQPRSGETAERERVYPAVGPGEGDLGGREADQEESGGVPSKDAT